MTLVGPSPEEGANTNRRRSAIVGVITVLQEEFDELVPLLGTTQHIPRTAAYARPGASSPDYDVVLWHLEGRGNVNAASGTMAFIEAFRPPYILLVGIAGGVEGRDNTCVGDVVVPNFVDYYEMRKLKDGKSLRRCEPYDQPAYALRTQFAQPMARDPDWLLRVDKSRRPLGDKLDPKVLTGMLISGEKVLSDDEAVYQAAILAEYDNAIAVDMESFGVAKAVFQMRSLRNYNPQYIIIRGISDVLRPRQDSGAEHNAAQAGGELPSTSALESALSNNEERKLWRPYAAHVAAAFAAALTDSILAQETAGAP
jgi:nucleoside phosphorylase